MQVRMAKHNLKAKLCDICHIKYLINPISAHYHKHDGKKFKSINAGWSRKYLNKSEEKVDTLIVRNFPSAKNIEVIFKDKDYDEMFKKHKAYRKKVLNDTKKR